MGNVITGSEQAFSGVPTYHRLVVKPHRELEHKSPKFARLYNAEITEPSSGNSFNICLWKTLMNFIIV